jgi:lipopolysaccharide heptosyltransferase II
MSLETWQRARRILCIRLDYLGDVLMCTPAIRALKESGSGRHITLLTSASGAAAARYVPEIDAVSEYAAPWMKSSMPHRPNADLQFVDTLRACRFDAAVIFTTYSQNPLPSALLCYLAEIPLRLAHCRENPYQLLTDWIRDPEPQEYVRHEVKRQLDLAAAAGGKTGNERLSCRIPGADTQWSTQRLHAMGIARDKPWVLLHPGATAASRRYPPELWAEAADILATRLRIPLVFTGGEEEVTLVETIRRSMRSGYSRSHSLAGKLDLGKLAAVIAQAPVMVSGNTGPAHIAAATGTPIVDLYALTNPQHTPWMVPSRVLYHDVPCRNCYKSICPKGHNACLRKIEPGQVAAAVADLLDHANVEIKEAAYGAPGMQQASPCVFPSALPIYAHPDSIVGL